MSSSSRTASSDSLPALTESSTPAACPSPKLVPQKPQQPSVTATTAAVDPNAGFKQPLPRPSTTSTRSSWPVALPQHFQSRPPPIVHPSFPPSSASSWMQPTIPAATGQAVRSVNPYAFAVAQKQHSQMFYTRYSHRIRQLPNALFHSNENDVAQQLPENSGRGANKRRSRWVEADTDNSEDESEENEERNSKQLKEKKQKADSAPARVIRRTNHVFRTRKQMQLLPELDELLVPIRIEVELENGQRIRDSFIWNYCEPLITPEKFAEIFCQDMDIPASYANSIANSIRIQVDECRRGLEKAFEVDQIGLVPIQLEFQIGRTLFQDRFFWDVSRENPMTPEQFATQLCAELGLGSEYPALISHSIHEQLVRHRLDFSASDPALDDAVRRPRRIHSVSYDLPESAAKDKTQTVSPRSARQLVTDILNDPQWLQTESDFEKWQPHFEWLDDEALEQVNRAKEREVRRLRRESNKFAIRRR